MANINTQTTNILDKKKITSTADTVGNIQNKDIKIPTSPTDEKYKEWEDGYNTSNKFKERLSNEISGVIFGENARGLKYSEGTDEDREFESNRLKGLSIDELYDELQYWNDIGKNTWDIDEESQGMPVKDWFTKMYKKLET